VAIRGAPGWLRHWRPSTQAGFVVGIRTPETGQRVATAAGGESTNRGPRFGRQPEGQWCGRDHIRPNIAHRVAPWLAPNWSALRPDEPPPVQSVIASVVVGHRSPDLPLLCWRLNPWASTQA